MTPARLARLARRYTFYLFLAGGWRQVGALAYVQTRRRLRREKGRGMRGRVCARVRKTRQGASQ